MKSKKISNIFFSIYLKKVYVYVINVNINFVNICNNENISLIILSRKEFDFIIKCVNFKIYTMIEKNYFLVFISKKINETFIFSKIKFIIYTHVNDVN